ncbi:MAG: DUF4435 domain-containing protein [Desulfomonilaceae bacterium]
MINLKRSQGRIHAFFESDEDRSFYNNFIYQRIEKDLVFNYSCDGKDQVYSVYDRIMKRSLGNNIALFFVDKDLEEFLGEEHVKAANIFVTDYYSIENYLVDDYMLDRILTELFHPKNVKLKNSEIKLKFQAALEQFYDLMRPLMAWVIYLRRNSIKVYLNDANTQFHKILKLDHDLTISTRTGDGIELLASICKVITPPKFASKKDAIVRELNGINPKKWIRGKYELWFFVTFC